MIGLQVLHSPSGTAAGVAESTNADPEKNADGPAGAGEGVANRVGQPSTERDKETKESAALGIARGEELMKDRAKKHEERYLLAHEAAKYFKHQTETWRPAGKMQDEEQKAIEGREDLKYGDIFKPNPDPPIQDTGDEEADKRTYELTVKLARLIQGANYYKGQLKAARESTEKLKEDELKAKLAHEQLYYGDLFK